MTRPVRNLVLLSLACVVLVVSVLLRRAQPSFFEKEVAALQRVTVPPGGSIATNSEPVRAAFHVSASWIVVFATSWTEYVAWLEKQPLRGYSLKQPTADTLEFVRFLDNDQLILRIERIPDQSNVRVRITLTGLAS